MSSLIAKQNKEWSRYSPVLSFKAQATRISSCVPQLILKTLLLFDFCFIFSMIKPNQKCLVLYCTKKGRRFSSTQRRIAQPSFMMLRIITTFSLFFIQPWIGYNSCDLLVNYLTKQLFSLTVFCEVE